MHAVVVKVTINEREAAETMLRGQVVPRVSQAPGFVAGYWLTPVDGQGLSVIVFDSEDAARAAADGIVSPETGEVTVNSAEVREVLVNA
jgi:hypothetical protein